ncbi:barstar family protein [Planobispora rosea]|uniref:barstar family protein n=1 Tax=Planobispora rosea TaxID=35762 RepID=UPI0019447969|nr:barstar family protein [Planobispora rosea]
MAVFDRDAPLAHQVDYRLMANTFVTLFWRRGILEETIDWLLAHGYEVVRWDASGWMTEDDLHRDFAQALDFPAYYGRNLDALNDCLDDVASGDYGVSSEATGLVLVLIGYDRFAARCPEVAQRVLDIIARNARSAILVGHRMFCLVQSDDPGIVFQSVGATAVAWNDAEWLDANRRVR